MLPPQIQTLGLSSCKIKEFTHFFGTAENLRYLDLSNNQIYGEIPQGIGKAKFYNLDLSENFLTGGIENLPWAFLDYLNLQSNMLNGSLPASICNSSSLDVLNLSHNNLSGVLPTCPSSLDYSLSVLDVRVNNIRGSLPSALSNFQGAQFQTFDEDSYGGNLALCGRPLSKRCNKEITETQEDADEDDDYFFSGFTWEAVTMGYGSGVVVGFLIGYVILRTRELKWLTRITAKKLGSKVRSLEIRRFA
ncbi:hypothetical protein ACET3Z_012275 [Daucus carota]